MRIRFALLVLLSTTSCGKDKVRVTESCALAKNGERFNLVVRYSDKFTDTLKNVDKMGWDKQEILLHRSTPEEGWMYIFDADDVMVKSYGIYSSKELPIRIKELGIENKFNVLPVQKAWEVLR